MVYSGFICNMNARRVDAGISTGDPTASGQ